jgi:multiple sugar transport system substrate-binding protein
MTSSSHLSRREFLRLAALSTGAAVVAGSASAAVEFLSPSLAEAAPDSKAPAAEQITLYHMYTPENDPYFKFVDEHFTVDYPNVTFSATTVPYDSYLTKLISTVAAGAPLDITTPDIIWIGQFTKAGLLLDVTDHLSDEERATYLPGLLEGLASGGRQMAIPAGAWFKNLFFNTEKIKEMDWEAPPKTYEELITLGKEAQEKGAVKFPMGWGWSQAEGLTCDWTLLLHAFGGTWFDDKGQWIMNNDAGVAALTYMVDNLHNGVFDPASTTYNDRTVMNPFLVGDYFQMTSWGTWGWSVADNPEESQVVGKVDVGLLPGTEVAGTTSATCAGMSGIGVLAQTKYPELAVEYIKRFSGLGHKDHTIAALDLAGAPPVQAWAWHDPDLVAKIPVLPKIAAQSTYMAYRPSAEIDKYTEWSTMCQIEIGKALAKEKTPKEALDAVVEVSKKDFPNVNF